MNRRIRNRVKLSALVVSTAALIVGGAVFTNIASAGTNGQQISLCSDIDGGTATISGINQNGEAATLEAMFNPIGCNQYHDQWWVGEVTIDFTTFEDPNPPGRPSRSGSTTCTIPPSNDTPPSESYIECRIH